MSEKMLDIKSIQFRYLDRIKTLRTHIADDMNALGLQNLNLMLCPAKLEYMQILNSIDINIPSDLNYALDRWRIIR